MSSGKTHRLGLHHGQVLWRLANTYNTLLLTIVEAIQNAIDADAQTVFVGIDRRQAQVIVLDDGTGVTEDKFRQALLSVGQGIKKKGSLGRFGLGLISPLNKCERFVFTSMPLGTQTANQWTFVGADIKEQHEEVEIPFRSLRGLPVIPKSFKAQVQVCGVQWRTMVHLTGVTQDRAISVVDADELGANIRRKLGPEMRRKGTTVHVAIFDESGSPSTLEIDPIGYAGEPLELVTIEEKHCGRVVFELYRAPKTGGQRRGEVDVMQEDDNYPIQWSEFTIQALGTRWLTETAVKEAFDALGSGFFEGVIRIQNVELAPERTKFVLNDALKASYIAIYLWFRDHGRKQYENEREARREQRYQELGEKSLRRIYDILESDPAFAGLQPSLVTEAPIPNLRRKPEKDEAKADETKRKRIIARHPDDEEGRPTRERKPREKIHAETEPQRAPLRYGYETMPGSDRLFEVDFSAATIVFNTRHPVWEMLDETGGKRTTRHDRQIMHLQEFTTLEILVLLAQTTDPDEFEDRRWSIDQRIKLYAKMFILTK